MKAISIWESTIKEEKILPNLNKNITSDGLPIIGSIDKDDTYFICTEFNTWGMTNASLSGKIISDLIMKRENIFKELFSPKRCNIIKNINHPVHIDMNALSFIGSKINTCRINSNEKIKYEKRNGKKCSNTFR